MYVSIGRGFVIFGWKVFSWGKKSRRVKRGGENKFSPPGGVHNFLQKNISEEIEKTVNEKKANCARGAQRLTTKKTAVSRI